MKRIRNLIEGLTYKERTKKKLKKYNEKVQRFRDMSPDELDMNYVEILTAYEQRKNITILILGTLLLAVIMDVWKYFFRTVNSLMLFLCGDAQASETVTGGALAVTYIAAGSVLAALVFVVVDLAIGLKKSISDKIFIEYFMKQTKGEDK